MAIAALVNNNQFDYVSWEIGALGAKVEQTLWGVQPFMDEADRTAYVRTYMTDLATANALEYQIQTVYADPAISDPETSSSERRQQRDALRADPQNRQSLVEAILEGQVAAVLVEQGFGVSGQLIPPISMRFTRVPNLLVISPRDQVRFDLGINLTPMTVESEDTLEQRVEDDRNVSALVVPLGGIALYPAMILETTSIQYALETFAHEWVHHYLFMFPLGLNYEFAGETRIINETTADYFGREVGLLVLERYYPDLVPPPAPETDPNAPIPSIDPNAFDFGRELNETRVTVDKLLSLGQILRAEGYMEKRRQFFVAHGYVIRTLNQAWFAFYGGYQAGTPGVAGDDPIGPSIEAIRTASTSVHEWIVTMRSITTRDELVQTASGTMAES